MIFLKFLIIALLTVSTLTYSKGYSKEELCAPQNAKFKKTYQPIKNELLPSDLWRSEEEKKLFFRCVESEESTVQNVIGSNPYPLAINRSDILRPEGLAPIIGNTRKLKVYPLEVLLEPGEYAFYLYMPVMYSYGRAIFYYSSEAIHVAKNEIYAGSWTFKYMPRIYEGTIIKVDSHYKNGKPVKKAVLRVMISIALFEEGEGGIEVGIFDLDEVVNKIKARPIYDATMYQNGQFY